MKLIPDAQMRLLPLLQGAILVGIFIGIAGLFPQTRSLQNTLVPALQVPLVIAIIVAIAYVGIRLSYATINRFVTGLTARTSYNDPDLRRLRLRTSTISSVIKNIATFVWIGVGIFVALTVAGVDFGLLLASFGLGLAFSLAAQNLIKGATKGFFIFPQREVWLHPSDSLKIDMEGRIESDRSSQNREDRSPPHRENAKTDRQPRNVPDNGDQGDEAESD